MGVVLGCGRRLATRTPPDSGKWADMRAHHGSNTAYNPNSFFKTANPGDGSEPRFAFDGSEPIRYLTPPRPFSVSMFTIPSKASTALVTPRGWKITWSPCPQVLNPLIHPTRSCCSSLFGLCTWTMYSQKLFDGFR